MEDVLPPLPKKFRECSLCRIEVLCDGFECCDGHVLCHECNTDMHGKCSDCNRKMSRIFELLPLPASKSSNSEMNSNSEENQLGNYPFIHSTLEQPELKFEHFSADDSKNALPVQSKSQPVEVHYFNNRCFDTSSSTLEIFKANDGNQKLDGSSARRLEYIEPTRPLNEVPSAVSVQDTQTFLSHLLAIQEDISTLDIDSSTNDCDETTHAKPKRYMKMWGMTEIQVNEIRKTDALATEVSGPVQRQPISVIDHGLRREPVTCPEEQCGNCVFVSDFNLHGTNEHPDWDWEFLGIRDRRTFFLDVDRLKPNQSKGVKLFLVKDKITDLGSNVYKDYQPLLVVCNRLKSSEFFGVSKATDDDVIEEYLMIWLTAIMPEDDEITVSLAVIEHYGDEVFRSIIRSCRAFSMQDSQEPQWLFSDGNVLFLPMNRVEQLRHSETGTLEILLCVH